MRNTTHDWAAGVDREHLEHARRRPVPGGTTHLVLEVLAYAAEEAESTGGGHCVVTQHPDGSISITDNGRGTDTRADAEGRTTKKPIMASKDLRFYDHPNAQTLPDGHPRQGMSLVAAHSTWLIHTNRRTNGAWTQRYEHGIPTTALTPIPADGTTGTTVHFQPTTPSTPTIAPQDLGTWSHLTVTVVRDT
ncbi:MAG TPA: ATP-binding protein [Umezawaea sp.]|nr:ATP-binding protein [Umezawaea sp.]